MDIRVLTLLYQNIYYLAFAVILASLLSVVVIVSPNIHLLQIVIKDQGVGLTLFNLVVALVLGSSASIGWLSILLILVNTALMSCVATLFLYFLNNRSINEISKGSFSATGGGLTATFVGIGCGACGPLMFGGFFAALGASGLLLLLPLHGAEFGILAALLLCYAVYSLVKVLTAPKTCGI